MPVNKKEPQWVCPNCGGSIEYNIEKGIFTCKSCGAESEAEQIAAQVKEYDFSDYRQREAAGADYNGISQSQCRQCGAMVMFQEKETAKRCPMCGSTQVDEAKQMAGIPPEGLIPFRITKEDAEARFAGWVKKRWFAPNKFKIAYEEGALRGVYFPFWTYDTGVVAYFTGRGGHTVTRRQGDKTVTTIQWYPVSGMVSDFFDDIQICASNDMSRSIVTKVLPFNTVDNIIPFELRYLAGMQAEHYALPADSGFEEAKRVIDERLRMLAEQQIHMRGFDHAQVFTVSPRYDDVSYKLVLLPVWTSVFSYNGKRYIYAVNGETGKVAGQRPYSPVKIALFAIVVFALAVIIMMLIDGGANGGEVFFD